MPPPPPSSNDQLSAEQDNGRAETEDRALSAASSAERSKVLASSSWELRWHFANNNPYKYGQQQEKVTIFSRAGQSRDEWYRPCDEAKSTSGTCIPQIRGHDFRDHDVAVGIEHLRGRSILGCLRCCTRRKQMGSILRSGD